MSQTGDAKGLKSYGVLKAMPILDDGRIKPLDTYARNLLIRFSGKDSFERKDAIQWLARLLFAPETTKDDKIFLINNPDIALALSIPPEKARRYSFAQLQKNYPKLLELAQSAQNITEKERSIVESEILRVFENLRFYAQLSHDFAFVFPHPDFNNATFLDTALTADQMRAVMANIEDKAQSQYTKEERRTLMLLSNLFSWSLNYKDLPLAIIPSKKGWLSPWDAITHDFKDSDTRLLLVSWRNMAVAFWSGQQIEFDLAGRKALDIVHTRLKKDERKKIAKFPLEIIYHGAWPFLWAKTFYIFAFVFFVISFISMHRCWYQLGWLVVIAGFSLHTFGLAARIIIMARPPVSNLYETFIFVGFISVLLGMIIEKVNKRWVGLVAAAVSGAVFLFIADKYSMEGDTLKVLIAVLNSNFWLATHVTSITMGYAATCVAGVLGHMWLIQAVIKHKDLEHTYSVMIGILGLALTLTFLGTNLGGIWADQSWGRFWGWDPKENGALMIVLWTAMLFHAKIGKIVGPLGMAAGCVLGMIVVMWAWFGVNLLSIGLHSYGFTSGIATALGIYVVAEIIFLAIIIPIIKKRV